ncbi:hypothetical protein FALBO_14486 [Fusarium albosuccineum]|uniref:Uncharacterized protein n=1 Tax=Fusarium albosuccineum TaxID=1237068 RepID=A0A8H4KZM9_9HYPO|nr:hypothetical protein FALBO_14486 [Fusarium albosuccineum]
MGLEEHSDQQQTMQVGGRGGNKRSCEAQRLDELGAQRDGHGGIIHALLPRRPPVSLRNGSDAEARHRLEMNDLAQVATLFIKGWEQAGHS